ncbi:MAG: Holo-[acyl-carrier-protein] synthase [Alphaproteobacteria bacterium MarineAlpha5_Bin9]|nr:MAG: Holo-[acyl-carrier-protein] synthase [Alphaproteobacteria bacterium MarineAlpha5_Bin9]|tara:strand:- start:130 stop:528 length:399 start_codon:yes stop_codon:yes gene_type:complete
MIIGMGTDIIDIRRIESVLTKFGKKFIERCFTENEIIYSEKKYMRINSYAKRYAAKEACAKALGTGLAQGIFWKDISVINNIYGKPYIQLDNNALKIIKKLTKLNYGIELSLSDEKNYAIANVIIFEKNAIF